ncbi:MAG: SDR family oxidoreductase [bacterium]|nr:SDR family oxidoreductase [bacterium]
MKLKNKTVIITGGSRGIGKAIADAFAREGADLFLIARTELELEATKKELEKYGTKIITYATDVANAANVVNVANVIKEHFEKIDVLINAAGMYGPIGKLEELNADEWIQTFAVNIFGTMLMCRAFLPMMKKQRTGRIINFAGGGEGAFSRFTAYVSSKGAVVRFTETLAEEIKDDGILVNAIAPGAVNTAFLEAVLGAGPEKAGKEFYEKSLYQKEEGGTPPELAAELCVFLASDESAGITGKVLSAKWDNWKEFPKHKQEIAESDVYTFRRIKPQDRNLKW